jgi:hypothetical protein
MSRYFLHLQREVDVFRSNFSLAPTVFHRQQRTGVVIEKDAYTFYSRKKESFCNTEKKDHFNFSKLYPRVSRHKIKEFRMIDEQ